MWLSPVPSSIINGPMGRITIRTQTLRRISRKLRVRDVGLDEASNKSQDPPGFSSSTHGGTFHTQSRSPIMWFTEDPWPPVFICGVAALVLFWWWWTTSQKALLTGAIAAVVLAGVIFVVEDLIVTDSGARRAGCCRYRECVSRKRSEPHVESFFARGHRRAGTGRRGNQYRRYRRQLTITDTSVALLDSGQRATIRFRANATATYPNQHERRPTRWEFEFARQGDEWKVTRIRRMNVVKDEYLDPLDPSKL